MSIDPSKSPEIPYSNAIESFSDIEDLGKLQDENTPSEIISTLFITNSEKVKSGEEAVVKLKDLKAFSASELKTLQKAEGFAERLVQRVQTAGADVFNFHDKIASFIDEHVASDKITDIEIETGSKDKSKVETVSLKDRNVKIRHATDDEFKKIHAAAMGIIQTVIQDAAKKQKEMKDRLEADENASLTNSKISKPPVEIQPGSLAARIAGIGSKQLPKPQTQATEKKRSTVETDSILDEEAAELKANRKAEDKKTERFDEKMESIEKRQAREAAIQGEDEGVAPNLPKKEDA